MFSRLLLLSNHQKCCKNLNSTLISLIAEEEGINEDGGDLSPNLLHKMNQEGGKIKKINKREGRNFRDEGEKS